jgi:hypothetical protein
MTSFHNYLRIKQYPLLREHILAIRKILDTYSKPQTLPGGKRAMKPVLLTEYGFQAEEDIAPGLLRLRALYPLRPPRHDADRP